MNEGKDVLKFKIAIQTNPKSITSPSFRLAFVWVYYSFLLLIVKWGWVCYWRRCKMLLKFLIIQKKSRVTEE